MKSLYNNWKHIHLCDFLSDKHQKHSKKLGFTIPIAIFAVIRYYEDKLPWFIVISYNKITLKLQIYMKRSLFVFALCFVALFAAAQTVYITRTGSKYHTEGCRYLSRSCIAISLSEAKSEGYEPCSVCDPPTQIYKRHAYHHRNQITSRRYNHKRLSSFSSRHSNKKRLYQSNRWSDHWLILFWREFVKLSYYRI